MRCCCITCIFPRRTFDGVDVPREHDLSHANSANPMIVRLAAPNLGGDRFRACPLTRHRSFVKNA